MKKSSLIITSILVFFLLITIVSAWDIENGLVREWAVEGVRPYGIETLSDGSVWFASDNDASIFILNPETGLPIVYTASFAGDFAIMDRAPDNTLWISDENDRIVHFSPCNPSGDYFTDFTIPRGLFTPDASPYGIQVAPDGMVWFTRWPDPSLGRYNPVTGIWDRFVLPEIDFDSDGDGDYPGTPALMTFDDEGNVWFTINRLIPARDSLGEYSSGMAGFGRLDPSTSTFTLYNDPSLFTASLVAPWEIAFTSYEPDILWFTDKTANYLIRVDLSVSPPDIEEYVTPYIPEPEIMDTHFFAIDPDGIFWLAPFFTSNIGTFNPTTHDFETRPLELYGSPINIVVSPFGEVWWAIPGGLGGEQRAVGRFVPFTDTDDDGIDNEIDSAPAVTSGSFSDGITSGNLDEAGNQNLAITDATEPFGIRMMADCDGGERPAFISSCGPLIQGIQLTSCDDIIVTSGSNTFEVIVGPIEIELEHGATLTASSRTTFSVTEMGGNTYRIENIGCPGTGIVTIGIFTIAPGESIIITPPSANAGPDQVILVGETVSFNGGASSDPDGTIVAYDWNFGDGSAHGSGVTTTHLYPVTGAYTVTLTVTDNEGLTGTDTAVVTVLTSCDGINYLKTVVNGMTIKASVKTGLNSKLTNANTLCVNGQKASAIKTMNNFITQCNTQRGLALTNTQADTLVNWANRIIAALRRM